MGESLASTKWQETVDLAVARLEGKTGLALAGLSQTEIAFRVRRWMRTKTEGSGGNSTSDNQSRDRRAQAHLDRDVVHFQFRKTLTNLLGHLKRLATTVKHKHVDVLVPE